MNKTTRRNTLTPISTNDTAESTDSGESYVSERTTRSALTGRSGRFSRPISRSATTSSLNGTLFKGINSLQFLQHESTLSPLMDGGYHSSAHMVGFAEAPFPLKHTLNVPIVSVTNLLMQPGDPSFLLWYYVSTFFPLCAACLAPLANMVSIVALVERWRKDAITGEYIVDSTMLVTLNALSLAFGIIGNISLLMNFAGRVNYLITQCLSIGCWWVASSFLIADLVLSNRGCSGPNPIYIRTQGFWYAVFTCFFYASCSGILLINFLGYRLKKYPPTFNLGAKQRTLMIHTIVFAAWCIVSSSIMQALIEELDYGSALYYIIVSFLTVGLGDILPQTHAAKATVLVCSLVGVLIMGLIIAMIRQVVISTSGPATFWHEIEKKRLKLLKKLQEGEIHLTPEETFHEIRDIRHKAKRQQINASVTMSVGLFLVFWLVGGVVFHKVEDDWLYFNSIYFCFLCLITIGYGDFAPKSEFGRSFFVCWAVSAVPLMTILISSVGDKIFESASRFSVFVSKWFTFDKYIAMIQKKRANHEDLTEVDDDSPSEEDEVAVTFDFPKPRPKVPVMPSEDDYKAFMTRVGDKIRTQKETYNHLLDFLEKLKPLMTDSLDDPLKKYDLDEWASFYKEMDDIDEEVGALKKDNPIHASAQDFFWVSDSSPLRLPIKEPNYMIMKVFFKIEKDLTSLVQLLELDEERYWKLNSGGALDV